MKSIVPDAAYGQLLGHSMYFSTKDVGVPVKFVAPSWALKDITKIPRYRQFNTNMQGCNFWWLEYGGRLDTIHQFEDKPDDFSSPPPLPPPLASVDLPQQAAMVMLATGTDSGGKLKVAAYDISPGRFQTGDYRVFNFSTKKPRDDDGRERVRAQTRT